MDELLAAVDELRRLGAVVERALADARDVRLVVLPEVGGEGVRDPPFSRIHATATDVSRPPEKAMPIRSPTGSDWRTRLMRGA